jgi:uncharacterized protein YjbI with pentapeptide repeats
MDTSQVKDWAGTLAAIVAALTALLGIPKYFQYRTRRDKMTLVRDAFESVVKSLASTVEVERLAGAILLRRFFDPATEVGIASAPYTKEVVNVIASILRSQETGTFQKTLVDGLAYAPSLRHTDLQRTNLQNAYLGSRPASERAESNGNVVDLSYADFYRSDLSGGSIKGATARGAIFYQARLQNTILKGADLRNANFFEADLHGAKFDGALLKQASFKNARNVPLALATRLDEHALYNEEGPFVAPNNAREGQLCVFLSKSASPDFRCDQLIASMHSKLNIEQMTVMTLERQEYPSFGALAEIKRLMAGCAGAVILGLRDLQIKDGLWREGTKEEISVRDRYVSTEWTQIEAGMAIMAGFPVLIVSEPGIRGGVFDIPTSEHLLYRAGIDELPSSTIFQDWCMAVRQTTQDIGFSSNLRVRV